MEILGYEFFHREDFLDLLFKFSLNMVFAFTIIRFIYYSVNKNKDFLFTLFVFNIVIFFVCAMLSSVKLKLGFAFGLFAVFSILRYRTEQIPIKEMTFLFLSITLAVINSLFSKKVGISEVIFTNMVILIMTWVLERIFSINKYSYKSVLYERIELITPEKEEELIADLRARTGLDIQTVEITKIDFLRDVAQIKIYYYTEK